MDVVGSEIGQKMRSAIKAKLTELGCYVDDELPDYVMVMVANKRTRSQMEDDLQLFLGDNTILFVNWLHHVLKKLQEVTVAAPTPSALEPVKDEKELPAPKDRKIKDKKEKKKDKTIKSSIKKSKKKSKHREHSKKLDKKLHKNKKKKKSKHKDMIRPNIPPLLMNMEKESEPSITDVFAGQILKNHGITLPEPQNTKMIDIKPFEKELKRPLYPIIDPATITTQSTSCEVVANVEATDREESPSTTVVGKQEQLRQINETEVKLQDLRQKLVHQLDSMSDDEDLLTIRAEAEELMNDFSDELFPDGSQDNTRQLPTPPPALDKPSNLEQSEPQPAPEAQAALPEIPDTLPVFELILPKRPAREKINNIEENKATESQVDKTAKNGRDSEERLTPDKELLLKAPNDKSSRSSNSKFSSHKKKSKDSTSDPTSSSKRVKREFSPHGGDRSGPASVVMVRPRQRNSAGKSTSNLLMRAVADAHKSLLNIPPKVEVDQKIRAMVLPMRRTIQIPGANRHETATGGIVIEVENEPKSCMNEEYVPLPITKKIINTNYTPTSMRPPEKPKEDIMELDPIDIHHRSTDKEKGPTFVVTLDGLDPNIFLAKKLKIEGLIDDENELITKNRKDLSPRIDEQNKLLPIEDRSDKSESSTSTSSSNSSGKKRLSDTSEDSDTQVIIKSEEARKGVVKKRRTEEEEEARVPKRKASPIVFDVDRLRVEPPMPKTTPSAGPISPSTSKFDSLPLNPTPPPVATASADRKGVPCRSFPLCRYGASCAFTHPVCKFATSCTRRNCLYTHPPESPPAQGSNFVASHVVPAANYQSISTSAVLPNLCKFYPKCANPGCHFYHPKPCRYGRACGNKLDCNFYHYDVPATKWRSPL